MGAAVFASDSTTGGMSLTLKCLERTTLSHIYGSVSYFDMVQAFLLYQNRRLMIYMACMSRVSRAQADPNIGSGILINC